jgi:uncharacterized membrane protein YphA (DoxX/SURF4 family)
MEVLKLEPKITHISKIPEPTSQGFVRCESVSRLTYYAQVFARLALSAGFLAAVADRFGFWGPYGSRNASWGDFAHFVGYTAQVNSFLPASWAPFLALAATVAELVLGLALVLGIWLRVTATASAILLLIFGSAMAVSFGIKQPLNYSVFSAAAAAFLLVDVEWSKRTLAGSKDQAKNARSPEKRSPDI